jgi:hypothetical protein
VSAFASLVAAAVLLQPVLADDGPLRVVAVGTGDDPVDWTLDGRLVATTADGEAASVPASSGPHELWATSRSDAAWRALARPDPSSPGGAAAVPAWTAVNVPAASDRALPSWTYPVASAAVAGLLLVRPPARVRSLLQGRGRRRRT